MRFQLKDQARCSKEDIRIALDHHHDQSLNQMLGDSRVSTRKETKDSRILLNCSYANCGQDASVAAAKEYSHILRPKLSCYLVEIAQGVQRGNEIGSAAVP